MARKNRGFTLIELIVVVAIVGILAAMAYPSYRDQVMSGNRAQAKTALLKAAQLEERWYTTRGTYTGTLGDLYGIGGSTITDNENPALPGKYNIAITPDSGAAGYAQGYTLTATPVAGADTICGNLSLTSTGLRTFSGTGTLATAAKCW